MKLRDKVAVVTGAGSGNGRAIAMEFAKEGAKVVIINRTRENGDETLMKIKDMKGEGISLEADVSNSKEFKEAIDKALEYYGRIDIMVNNAGIFDGQDYETTDEETFEKIINVNLKGVFLGTKFVLDNMLKNQKGVIINIASVAGIRGGLGSPAYTASKHGIIGLTGDAATNYGKDGVRSIAICPGMIETSMTKDILEDPSEETQQLIDSIPLQRTGKPEDIGKLAVFLASDDSSYINGTPIVIDGGLVT
ncbi:SDR family NAD(P)-dependent oxidoreductase [Alkaliphilus serpentinus]|uniref:Glucose 1-dehydrogenase n=1 Tax=Alkaliphilus serpentinus TaxID=1482731 RepID=A0A833M8J2_9FIRM|nr:glucose 1-dehydrogenase [Alkaliphilus serpentinus]KAB3525918.1 glucose 1-dehydrogenase [Alkaliphilus serpentinus]